MGTAEYDPNKAGGGEPGAEPALETDDAGSGPKPSAPKRAPMGAMYTMTAREGVNAAQLINGALAKRTIGKVTPRRIEVAAPLGQSTSGGKKARQSVTLVAAAGGGAALMCGWIDPGQKAAELRDFRAVAEQHQTRLGMPFDATLAEYAALLKELEVMLKALGFEVSNAQPEVAAAPAAAPTPRANPLAVAAARPNPVAVPAARPNPLANSVTSPAAHAPAAAAGPAARPAAVVVQPLAAPDTSSSSLKTVLWVVAAAVGGAVIAVALTR